MKVTGTIVREININPRSVIETLKSAKIGSYFRIFKRDEKYYKEEEIQRGAGSWDEITEISKEDFEFGEACELILEDMKSWSKTHYLL
jgi:hypothetical protein